MALRGVPLGARKAAGTFPASLRFRVLYIVYIPDMHTITTQGGAVKGKLAFFFAALMAIRHCRIVGERKEHAMESTLCKRRSRENVRFA